MLTFKSQASSSLHDRVMDKDKVKAELTVSPETCSTGVGGLFKSRVWVRGQLASTRWFKQEMQWKLGCTKAL